MGFRVSGLGFGVYSGVDAQPLDVVDAAVVVSLVVDKEAEHALAVLAGNAEDAEDASLRDDPSHALPFPVRWLVRRCCRMAVR